MDVAVIGGAGYVGIVTGLGLAHIGHNVIGADRHAGRVGELSGGVSPLYERGLQELLDANLGNERMRFTSNIAEAVAASEIVFITVDTPVGDSGRPDLSRVLSATREIAGAVSSYKIIVVKSTIPVDAVNLIDATLADRLVAGRDYDLVFNPEFLREGTAVWDFFHPTRIVIGSGSPSAMEKIECLYTPLLAGHPTLPVECPPTHSPIPVIRTNVQSAQIIKYAANGFLALRVSFVNEIAQICEAVGADVLEVVEGIGHDPRIGHSYLSAGLGFGGPCLEKDLRGLIATAQDHQLDPILMNAVLSRNDRQIEHVISRIKSAVLSSPASVPVGIFGLSFKPHTDDVRNSLSLRVIDALTADGIAVRAYDPVANGEASQLRPDVDYFDDPYEAASGVGALAILTNWPEFKDLDYERIASVMTNPTIVDAQNLLADIDFELHRINYIGIGRPAVDGSDG